MKIHRLEEIDSTNTYIKNIKSPSNYEMAIAKVQTAGRGRRGNTWKSMEGAALFSFALKEDRYLPIEEYRKLPLLVGVAVLRALKKILDMEYKFKWTNDIYATQKKISGILVEKVDDFFVIGIGINVNNSGFGELSHKATSLRELSGEELDREGVALKVVDEFKRVYIEFLQGGWQEILLEINSNNFLKDREVEVDIRTRVDKGIARNIAFDGTLEVEIEGIIKNYDIGEVHISYEKIK